MQSLAGTIWKVVDARTFDSDGGALPPPLGPLPMGIVIFGPERMVGVLTDGRASMPADALSRFFVAYTGPYSFNGTELVTRADDASRPELLVEQVRRLRFESPTRMMAVPVSGVPGANGIEVAWERIG